MHRWNIYNIIASGSFSVTEDVAFIVASLAQLFLNMKILKTRSSNGEWQKLQVACIHETSRQSIKLEQEQKFTSTGLSWVKDSPLRSYESKPRIL